MCEFSKNKCNIAYKVGKNKENLQKEKDTANLTSVKFLNIILNPIKI